MKGQSDRYDILLVLLASNSALLSFRHKHVSIIMKEKIATIPYRLFIDSDASVLSLLVK